MHPLTSAITLLLLATIGIGAEELPAPAPLRHVRVMWMTNPATQAMISWTTSAISSSNRVWYDTTAHPQDPKGYRLQSASLHDGAYSGSKNDAGLPTWYHHALLSDLTPATTYYFTVASDSLTSQEFHFTTAPADDRPVTLIYGADSRRGPPLPAPHEDRLKMNRLIATLTAKNPGIIALAHGGDYCTSCEWKFMSVWLDDHDLTYTVDRKILPLIPARGNHDSAIGFEEIFYWPTRTTSYYYATKLSSEITLLALNSEASVRGDQQDWLDKELAENRPHQRWMMAMYHRPAWGSVKSENSNEDMRQAWVPLFEKYNIDLVCESDNHTLKRTVPIRNEKMSEDGIIYIGDGGLGVPQRKPDTKRWYLQSPGFAKPAHHVHLLDFGKDTLHVRAIGADEEVLDDFTLHPRSALVGAGK
jgi:acid phosphatase type 7